MTTILEPDTVVVIASKNGDGLVPSNLALAAAKEEAKVTGSSVTLRDEISDAHLCTVHPDGRVQKADKQAAKAKVAKAKLVAPRATRSAKPAKAPKAKTTKVATRKATEPKSPKAPKPSSKKAAKPKKATGMTGELVQMALRAKGATPKELNERSGWRGCPWRWFFSNRLGTGVADRFGLKLRVERDGRNVAYRLTRQD
jgi:hypothetical protein